MSVLFVSQLPLGRCENLTAVWNAYDGEKEFRLGVKSMRSAEADGFAVVVCDCQPAFIDGKSRCVSINIGHGAAGGKLYGADEGGKPWFDALAAKQIDFALAPSKDGIPIVMRQLGIPEERVLPLGMPRTDSYFAPHEPHEGKVYLHAPTFRNGDGRIPRINWVRLDSLLGDDEQFVVKRHYFTHEPLVCGKFPHIVEVEPDEPSKPYLLGCDVVLTDYSSIMFDAYMLGKPVVLATDDMREYLSRRGMYYPYPFDYSSRHLAIEGREDLLLFELRDAARNGMGPIDERCREMTAAACDGHSTERVCELIKSVL